MLPRATAHIRDYERRDRVLATQAAAAILLRLLTWLALFYVGFALLLSVADRQGVGSAFAQAGSSLFTLGYAGPTDAPLTAIDCLAAATGLVVAALQIGYLPTLDSSFNRRETEVSLLAARAGTPPWGPELLGRTRYGFESGDEGAVMDDFYLNWERGRPTWPRATATTPVLVRFRSPRPPASWVVAMIAVLDSAALWLALSPARAPRREARLALRTGFVALRCIADSLGIPADPGPDPVSPLQLTYEEYRQGIERIASTSLPMDRTPEEAWPDVPGRRVHYEAVAYALAARTDAVPTQWTGHGAPETPR